MYKQFWKLVFVQSRCTKLCARVYKGGVYTRTRRPVESDSALFGGASLHLAGNYPKPKNLLSRRQLSWNGLHLRKESGKKGFDFLRPLSIFARTVIEFFCAGNLKLPQSGGNVADVKRCSFLSK